MCIRQRFTNSGPYLATKCWGQGSLGNETTSLLWKVDLARFIALTLSQVKSRFTVLRNNNCSVKIIFTYNSKWCFEGRIDDENLLYHQEKRMKWQTKPNSINKCSRKNLCFAELKSILTMSKQNTLVKRSRASFRSRKKNHNLLP